MILYRVSAALIPVTHSITAPSERRRLNVNMFYAKEKQTFQTLFFTKRELLLGV